MTEYREMLDASSHDTALDAGRDEVSGGVELFDENGGPVQGLGNGKYLLTIGGCLVCC